MLSSTHLKEFEKLINRRDYQMTAAENTSRQEVPLLLAITPLPLPAHIREGIPAVISTLAPAAPNARLHPAGENRPYACTRSSAFCPRRRVSDTRPSRSCLRCKSRGHRSRG